MEVGLFPIIFTDRQLLCTMEKSKYSFSTQKFLRESVDFFIEFIRSLLLGLSNFWKTGVFILFISTLLFLLSARKSTTYYRSKASFTYNFVHKKVYGDLIFYLEQLVGHSQHAELANVLDITLEQAKEMRTISAKNIVNSPLHQDFTFDRIPFYVYLECEDKKDIQTIQNGLLNYILSDSANNVVAQKEITDYQNTLSFVKEDLARIDELLASSACRDSVNVIELLYLAKERQKELISLENRLSDLNSIALLKAFQPIEITKWEQNKSKLKKYGSVAILLVLFSSVFLQWYKNPNHEV